MNVELVNTVIDDMANEIARLKEKLAEREWIPRSEPPKNEGTYLVYAPDYRGGSSSTKENHNGVMFSKYKNGKWSIEYGYYERPNCVKAWMPLPEPYRGDDHE